MKASALNAFRIWRPRTVRPEPASERAENLQHSDTQHNMLRHRSAQAADAKTAAVLTGESMEE